MSSVDEFERLQPQTFGRIREITVENSAEGAMRFQMILATDDPADARFLTLRCEDVTSLVLGDVHGGQWCVLTAADISDRQWDGLYYAINDVEEEVLSLFCRTFTAEVE